MDPTYLFFLCLSGVYAVLEYRFFRRFSGAEGGRPCRAVLVCAAVFLVSVMPQPLSILCTVAVLAAAGRFLLRVALPMAVAAAALAVAVVCMVNGIANSAAFLLHETFVSVSAGGMFSIAVSLMTLPVIFLLYFCIERFFAVEGTVSAAGAAILVLPVLFILVVTQMISSELYGNVIVMDANGAILSPVVDSKAMLLVQLVAFLCLGAVLFAFWRFSRSNRIETQNALLMQQIETQREYMREATGRYEGTRVFRHDMKNHFIVLDGLLNGGEIERARAYLADMERIADVAPGVFKTGNAVIDVLFASKLGAAEQAGVRVECALSIPQPCPIPEIDLCVLFSNAIDNALKACAVLPEERRFLCMRARQRGSFFFVEVENSAGQKEDYPVGQRLGLRSIRMIAERHHGTVETEQSEGVFTLSILLQNAAHNISQQGKGIPRQTD